MLKIFVVDNGEDFAALEEEWEDLYRHSPRSTPFQSWAWLYSWWEFYGEGYELRVISLRGREGLLVGLIPLVLKVQRPLSRLLLLGTGPSDYLDVLVREGWEREVSKSATQALEEVGTWHLADFHMLRPDAAAWKVFERWKGPKGSVWQEGCPLIPVRSEEEVISSLSRNHRSTVRRSLRRARADGVRRELAEDAERAAGRLMVLSREQWSGNPLAAPEHFESTLEAHLRVAARRMAARGFGAISELSRDGKPLISTFMVFGRNFTGTYMIGAGNEARRLYQWSPLYILDALEAGKEKNHDYLDLLAGLEPYKLRWKPEIVPNHRLILGRNQAFWEPLIWSAFFGYQTLRFRFKRHARSEEAPRWARIAADGARGLRNELAKLSSRRLRLTRFAPSVNVRRQRTL